MVTFTTVFIFTFGVVYGELYGWVHWIQSIKKLVKFVQASSPDKEDVIKEPLPESYWVDSPNFVASPSANLSILAIKILA